MPNRLELLTINRNLVLEILEELKVNIKLPIQVIEDKYSISIVIRKEKMSNTGWETGGNFTTTGAQLKFTQDPNDGIEVRRIIAWVVKIGDRKYSEIVENIPPQRLSKKNIIQLILTFSEEIQKEWE